MEKREGLLSQLRPNTLPLVKLQAQAELEG